MVCMGGGGANSTLALGTVYTKYAIAYPSGALAVFRRTRTQLNLKHNFLDNKQIILYLHIYFCRITTVLLIPNAWHTLYKHSCIYYLLYGQVQLYLLQTKLIFYDTI